MHLEKTARYIIWFLVSVFLIATVYTNILIKREYKQLASAEAYYESLAQYDSSKYSRFFTPGFISDLERQAALSPAFGSYLVRFKSEEKKYPVNLLEFLFKHIALNSSPPVNIDGTNNAMMFEVNVGGSVPVNVQLWFNTESEKMRLDRITNLHTFFEQIDCRQKEWLETEYEEKNRELLQILH